MISPFQHLRYLYIIGPKYGPYKIGIAVNPNRRLAILQVGNHLKLLLHQSYRIQNGDAFQLEKDIHKSLHQYRLLGEWFDCSIPIIESVINNVNVEAIIDNKLKANRKLMQSSLAIGKL